MVSESLADYIRRTNRHPVAELIKIGFSDKTPLPLRINALAAASPYVAPKLQAVAVMVQPQGPHADAGAELLQRLENLDVPLLIESAEQPQPLAMGSRREITQTALALLEGGNEE